jgi:hypothetical protein
MWNRFQFMESAYVVPIYQKRSDLARNSVGEMAFLAPPTFHLTCDCAL